MQDLIPLLKQLIACPSVTPHDAGCLEIIKTRLSALGFQCESMRFGEVDNLWAKYGQNRPLLLFAGHTDVVPPGPLSDWTSPPFQAAVRDDFVYGRGTADMKGALASMMIAVQHFLERFAGQFNGSIGFLLTSDEEGPSIDGTQKVIEVLQKRGEKIDFCIIGEPSSDLQLGDQIRVGRRGSLHGQLTITGKQGHVAHPHLANNPIHNSMLALHNLSQTEWDTGNQHFPATTFQITNIHAGTGATNVIPGHLEVLFNFRFSTAVTVKELQERTAVLLKKHGINDAVLWKIGAEPFLTQQGTLVTAAQQAIKEITGLQVRLSTGGGTSDGRFIIKTGAELIELGVSNATAHHVDECVNIKDLTLLTNCYVRLLELVLRADSI